MEEALRRKRASLEMRSASNPLIGHLCDEWYHYTLFHGVDEYVSYLKVVLKMIYYLCLVLFGYYFHLCNPYLFREPHFSMAVDEDADYHKYLLRI